MKKNKENCYVALLDSKLGFHNSTAHTSFIGAKKTEQLRRVFAAMETYHITLTYVISGLAGIKRNTNHYAHDWSGSKSGVSVVLRIAWQVCNQLLLIHKMRKGNQEDHFFFFFPILRRFC